MGVQRHIFCFKELFEQTKQGQPVGALANNVIGVASQCGHNLRGVTQSVALGLGVRPLN